MTKEKPLRIESIFDAIEQKDLKAAEAWLKLLPESVNAYNETDHSALEMALGAGPEFVELLIKHGASINQQDTSGGTALHLACRRNDVEMVALLLKHGANDTLKNNSDFNAIHWAIYAENEAVLKFLLGQRGFNLTARNNVGESYLEFCIKYGGDDEQTTALASIIMDHGTSSRHLKSALAICKDGARPQCGKAIEARMLVLKEQRELKRVVASSLHKKQTSTDQEQVSREKESNQEGFPLGIPKRTRRSL